VKSDGDAKHCAYPCTPSSPTEKDAVQKNNYLPIRERNWRKKMREINWKFRINEKEE
jgi:hypothetical protein